MRRGRRHSRNGASAALHGVTSGFNTSLLSKAAVAVAGAISNNLLSGQLVKLVPVDFLKTGPGSYITSLLSAGLVGVGAKMVVPAYAGQLFFGAVLDVVSRVASKYVMPLLPGSRMAGMALADYFTGPDGQFTKTSFLSGEDPSDYMSGMGDFLTQTNVNNAQFLAGMGEAVVAGELE